MADDGIDVQVYAGLRRLGYTVQRTPQFLPHRFRKQPAIATSQETISEEVVPATPLTQRLVVAMRRWAIGCARVPGRVWMMLVRCLGTIVTAITGGRRSTGSLLDGHGASNYGKLGQDPNSTRIEPSIDRFVY